MHLLFQKLHVPDGNTMCKLRKPLSSGTTTTKTEVTSDSYSKFHISTQCINGQYLNDILLFFLILKTRPNYRSETLRRTWARSTLNCFITDESREVIYLSQETCFNYEAAHQNTQPNLLSKSILIFRSANETFHPSFKKIFLVYICYTGTGTGTLYFVHQILHIIRK